MSGAAIQSPSSRPRRGSQAPLARPLGLLTVAAIHLVLIAALWQTTPLRTTASHKASPVIVELLAPPRVEPPPPPPPPPRPRVTQSVERPLASFVPLPEIDVPQAEAPPIALAVPTLPPPANAESMPASAPVPAAAPSSPAPKPMTPPRFDADYLRNPAPEYPAFAKRRGEEGRVLLRVSVGVDGLPRAIVIHTTSGFERLDNAALETVRHWKFIPARVGGDAVEAWVIVPISFHLAH